MRPALGESTLSSINPVLHPLAAASIAIRLNSSTGNSRHDDPMVGDGDFWRNSQLDK